MTAERESYEEEPPPDWTPKSRFVRWWWARADYHKTHPQVMIPCPHCGESFGLVVTTETTEPDFVIKED